MKRESTGNTHGGPLAANSSENVNPHLFEQVLDASDVAMAIRDTRLMPLFANQAFRDFYGHTMEYIRTTPKEVALPADTITLYADEIQPAMATGLIWEGTYDIRIQSGGIRTVWGRFTPVLDDEANLTHVVSIMRDATKFEQMRKALTQTERHLSFLAENPSDCLFRVRLSDGRCDYISSAIESITGYHPQEFYDTPKLFRRLFPDAWRETIRQWWQEFRQGISDTNTNCH